MTEDPLSEAQRLIADELRRSLQSWIEGFVSGLQCCDQLNLPYIEQCVSELCDDMAPEVDKALGVLVREEATIPTWIVTDEVIPNRLIGPEEPEFVPRKRLDFLPNFRWVSGWKVLDG